MPAYVYLRPEKLPEFDDFKSSSILAETVLFYKRIVELIPKRFGLEGRVKEFDKYLTCQTKTFPSFQALPPSETRGAILDVLYLLADYYFKNNEFPTAIEYYRQDLSFNCSRVDSWFPMALSMINGLEQKLNETVKAQGKFAELTSSQVRGILSEADQVFRCLKKSLSLSPNNTTICIESANFAFTMSAFCSRQQRLFRTGTTTTNQEGSEEQVWTLTEFFSVSFL